jgi:hypothetical protein
VIVNAALNFIGGVYIDLGGIVGITVQANTFYANSRYPLEHLVWHLLVYLLVNDETLIANQASLLDASSGSEEKMSPPEYPITAPIMAPTNTVLSSPPIRNETLPPTTVPITTLKMLFMRIPVLKLEYRKYLVELDACWN